MQVYVSPDPKGPWKHYNMGGSTHDVSVLFEGDKIYAIYGYDEVHCMEIKPDFSPAATPWAKGTISIKLTVNITSSVPTTRLWDA